MASQYGTGETFPICQRMRKTDGSLVGMAALLRPSVPGERWHERLLSL